MESQVKKLYDLLSDGDPHRTDEILKEVYGNEHKGLARIGARVSDIKNGLGVPATKIKGWKDEQYPTLYWYQMKIDKDWRRELVAVCARQGCRTADEILGHILCRTGLKFESPQEVSEEVAKYLLREFNLDKQCY